MTSRTLLIDANLLVLWAVGAVSPDLVEKHKRLGAYVRQDFQLLLDFASQYSKVLVTPNTLTEASNLALQIGGPARAHIADQLREIAEKAQEMHIESRSAMARQEFVRLGLADSVQLEIKEAHLLTDDLGLFQAALALGKTSFNFTHLREAAGITS